MGNYMDCIICNKDFYSQNNANQHLNSSAHKRALSNWKKHLPKVFLLLFTFFYFYYKSLVNWLTGTCEDLSILYIMFLIFSMMLMKFQFGKAAGSIAKFVVNNLMVLLKLSNTIGNMQGIYNKSNWLIYMLHI